MGFRLMPSFEYETLRRIVDDGIIAIQQGLVSRQCLLRLPDPDYKSHIPRINRHSSTKNGASERHLRRVRYGQP